ncbi:MAG TPA: hypothetical protein VLH38_01010 [Patescibacteria group bacterium]|nr:hypothetical protein [Patescibacteria group bacterium]
MSYHGGLTPVELSLGEGLSRSGIAHKPVVGRVFQAARSLVAGSKSGALVWPEWHGNPDVKVIGGGHVQFVVGAGNPEAGRLPRSYNKAIVMGLGSEAVKRAKEQEGGECLPAVAYGHKGVLHVGVLGCGFGEVTTKEGGTVLAVGAREGSRPIEGTAGLWYPRRELLVLPDSPILVADLVPTNEFAARYPGVPMV